MNRTKRVLTFLRNHHQDIFRVLLILLAVVLLTGRFPRQGQFRYDFSVNKPWNYGDLVAPASFPILKSEEELAAEQEQVLKDVYPFYVVRPDIASQVKEAFEKGLSERLSHFRGDTTYSRNFRRDSVSQMQMGRSILDDLYNPGIMRPDDVHRALDESNLINLVEGNNVSPIPIGKLRDITDARQFAEETLAGMDNPAQRNLLTTTLRQAIEPNIFFDSATTNGLIREAIQQVALFRGAVQKDEAIIRNGEIVTPEKYQILLSYKEYSEGRYGERDHLMVLAGYFIVTALLLTIFGVFVFRFSRDVFRSTRKVLFILFLIVGMLWLVSWTVHVQIPSYYVIPFCIVPIVLRTFFGTQLSLYAHLVVVLLASFFVPLGVEFTALNIVAGMVAIFTNIRVHYWSQFFVSIGFILLTYSVGFLGISFIQEGSLMTLRWMDFGWLTINVFLTLMAYPLIPIFEKLFGYVSDITLMELGDLGKPLLKELQLKTPGTFQHSLQVANLAEAAAAEIGANALLVKVGSLYHDIGKMDNPGYFIENQSSRYNPHDELPFDESARIIIDHVPKGVEMAKKAGLPDVLIDFIRTHHGNTRVEYFYRNYIKNFPAAGVDEAKFRYPGPLPFDKETAVVMMADTVEAAARSLKEPTREDLDKLVDGLIRSKIETEQLINSTITFKDITRVKQVFKKMLYSIYHVRIEYPE